MDQFLEKIKHYINSESIYRIENGEEVLTVPRAKTPLGDLILTYARETGLIGPNGTHQDLNKKLEEADFVLARQGSEQNVYKRSKKAR